MVKASLPEKYDFIIIGSGFGGSVSALRLAEKGYKVAVLEKGKRWQSQDFPKTNLDVKKFLWAPLLRCFGIQKITLFRNVFVLSGVGVGGGSLVYANTHVEPIESFYQDPIWSHLEDWQNKLAPHYRMARKMLGTQKNTHFSESDEVLKKIGVSLGCEETFESVDVGVYFGEPGKEVADPYFEGQGPRRSGCNYCGGCMVGCRFNAKNTLDKNYLFLAEKKGVCVLPETEARKISKDGDGYKIETRSSTSLFGKPKTYHCDNVVFAGGVLGTVKLLLENKFLHKTLPHLSSQLGQVVRTNGESLVGATSLNENANYTDGLAITSSIRPDALTKIEVVRYNKGSNFMKWLAAPLVGPGSNFTRPFMTLYEIVRSWKKMKQLWFAKDWAAQTIILLVMQKVDNQISLGVKRKWFLAFKKGFGSLPSQQKPIPAYIEVADKAARIATKLIDGTPQVAFSESFLNAPATAHVLGGAKIGATPKDGVVDKYGRVFNYPGLYIVDGSVIPANLGVNPSLTITALAEWFMSHIKDKRIAD